MPSIKLGDHIYEIVKDGFGTPTINGMFVDEFLDWLMENDSAAFAECIRKGLDVAVHEPERLDDIADRIEMPPEQYDLMRRFGSREG